MTEEESERARLEMVRTQLESRGIRDERILTVMGRLPRERFVEPKSRARAYDDTALPLAGRQTISQPYMTALMVASLSLSGTERVLEVGTGSGYMTAILAELASEVWTVERIPELAERARATLAQFEYTNVHSCLGDGSVGWPEGAPFDAIVVSAAAPEVPHALVQQLEMGGRLVIPVGDLIQQELMLLIRSDTGVVYKALCPCAFVPLLGEGSWQKKDDSPGPRS